MSATNFVSNTLSDTQTTVTSLGAAIAGVLSERVGNVLVRSMPTVSNPSVGLGNIGLSFIARSIAASVSFSAAAALMPETSQNIFFSIIFFACNPSLVSNGRDFANVLVDGIWRQRPAPVRPGNPSPIGNAACASGGCSRQ